MNVDMILANLGAEVAMVATGQHHNPDLDEATFRWVVDRVVQLAQRPPLVTDVEPTVDRIDCNASVLSIQFDDYLPEARAKHEGKDMAVTVHVPIRFAPAITMGTPLVLEVPR